VAARGISYSVNMYLPAFFSPLRASSFLWCVMAAHCQTNLKDS
jgi:hypothetical protein